MDVRCFWLIPILLVSLVLGMLLSALSVPSAVHAQANVGSVSQQQRATSDSGGNYFFNAGWWGWGICLSHDRLQGDYDWSTTRLIVGQTVAGKVSDWRVQLAGFMLWVYLGSLKMQDRGHGMCVAWPYYIPSTVPIAWPQ